MTLTRIFDEIESSEFAGTMNVASGLRIVAKTARSHPLVGRLIADLPPRGGAEVILARLLEVTERAVDPRFENPYDVALMLYLLLLERMSPPLAQVAAAEVLQVPGMWWAGKVAAGVAGAGRAHNEAGSSPAHDESTTAVADGCAFIRAAAMCRDTRIVLSETATVWFGAGDASSDVPLKGAKGGARVSSLKARGSGALAA